MRDASASEYNVSAVLLDAFEFIGSVKPISTILAVCFVISGNSIDAVIQVQEMLSVHKRTALLLMTSLNQQNVKKG